MTRDAGTGTPGLAANAQWIRLAVDADTDLDPRQLRGQIEGAVAQGIGTTLLEDLRTDRHCRVTTAELRTYSISHAADVPPTDVRFGPLPDPDELHPRQTRQRSGLQPRRPRPGQRPA